MPLGKTEKDYWRSSGRCRADSTINRYLNALRKALKIMGRQRHPTTGQPLFIPPIIPKLNEPDELPRPISSPDLTKILDKAPDHLANMVRLCALMGFRLTEALSLTIDHVDQENRGIWLKGRETKGKRGEFIPANREAMELLRDLIDQAKKRKLCKRPAVCHLTVGTCGSV